MEFILIVKALAGTLVTMPSRGHPYSTQWFRGGGPSHPRCTVYSTVYKFTVITHYTPYDHNENSNEQIGKLITLGESFACQKAIISLHANVKKNTSSVFTLLQSNYSLLI